MTDPSARLPAASAPAAPAATTGRETAPRPGDPVLATPPAAEAQASAGSTPAEGQTAAPAAPLAGLIEWAKTLVYAVLIAVAFRTFLFQPFSIPSSSMEQTLLIGDYIFVNKFTYGYRWSWLGLSVATSPPQRGDVVVFKLPKDGVTDYIKRVVGLPGDRIQMRANQLYINDVLVPRQPTINPLPNDLGNLYLESLPNREQKHVIRDVSPNRNWDNTGVYTVPEGHYFMMGDNRDNSTDSRSPEVGFVPDANLVGRAEVIFFSLGDNARIWELWRWPFAIRFGRLGQTIR